jgi:class 3 adenylate cyclase/DNA-binding SARP family transcriptional activator/tetratricopeptide (TPR) repeat protein
VTHRLAAILAADVVGYTRLMHEDEYATHERVSTAIAEVIEPAIARHGGRVVKSTGDGVLAEFSSAVGAVQSGLEFQHMIRADAATQSPARRILFRVGIDVGDIIVEERDIYGDHVNLAARLQQLADPGGIVVSGSVHDYVHGRLQCRFEDAGEQRVKNIARPVHSYRVRSLSHEPPFEPHAADAATGEALRISLFGPSSLQVADRDIRLRSLKARAMLGYIALSATLQESRERLVGLLWSEAEEDKARATLRQLLHDLRGTLAQAGYHGLRVGAREIGLDRETIEVDVWAVIGAAEAGEAHPLLLERPRLADELLAGLDDLDPAFRVWLLAKRTTLRDRLLRGLETALVDADGRRAIRIAEAIINLDPTHEEACRCLMRARAEAGDTAGALRAYKTLWDLLDQDYGMEPSAPTQQLVAAIKTGMIEPKPVATRAAASGPHHPGTASRDAHALKRGTRLALSLQPVGMRGIDPDRAHLVQGFRQHLIASLIRFREWKVTDAPFYPPETGVGEDICGRYELQMLAYQGGGAVHLMLVLKDLETSLYVWSEGFELNLESWFEAQRRIVQRIAMALNVHVSAERLRRLSDEPDIPLGTYDRWLRAQARLLTFDPAHWKWLERELNEIVSQVPNFAPAHCSLASLNTILHIVHPGVYRSRLRERRSLDVARTAVQIDPVDTRAQLCLGWSYAMGKHYGQGEVHMDLACELNPNDSWTLISAALFHAFCGRSRRALALAARSLDLGLAPSRTHWAYQVSIQFLSGDYEATIDAADRARDIIRTLPGWRAAALFNLGRHEEAAADAARFLTGIRENWFGAEPASDEAITRWLLHLYPIRHREDWERLRDGLLGAGLPVHGMDHHAW